MENFPVEHLACLAGVLTEADGHFRLEFPLAPFALPLPDRDQPHRVDTALRLDQVRLPDSDFAHLAGQSLVFPLNPHAGYIDGSIYLDGAHHPVDVSKITCGTNSIDGIEIEIEAQLIFEFEGLGPYRNTPWTLNSLLRADS